MLIACAAATLLSPNVIVSELADVVIFTPVPDTRFKSSSNFSALTVVCPETLMLANPKLALPEPPLPLTATVSTELILP